MAHKNLFFDFKRPTPRDIEYQVLEGGEERHGKILVYPFERGYGVTVANALRRALLSSLPGYAVTGIVINYSYKRNQKLLTSIFDNIPGVYEDTLQIVQNLKRVRMGLLDAARERKVFVEIKNKNEWKASDLMVDDNIMIANPDMVIAHLSDDVVLHVEMTISIGRGYVPSEVFQQKNSEVGFIALDGIFSPVERVNYKVSPYRIEQRTDYEQFEMEILTDGTISVIQAVADAAKILKVHFETLIGFDESVFETVIETNNQAATSPEEEKLLQQLLIPLEELELSARAFNCLLATGLLFVGDVVRKNQNFLSNIKNLGQKSLDEIHTRLEGLSLQLGMPIPERVIQQYEQIRLELKQKQDSE